MRGRCALALTCALAGHSATTPADRREYTPAGSAFNVATGDFNGDGILDIVGTSDSIAGSVSVLLGTGDGTFAARPIVSHAGLFPSAVAVGVRASTVSSQDLMMTDSSYSVSSQS